MATKRRRPSGTWEFIVRRKGILPKPLSLTFDTEKEGDDYCCKLESLLDSGIVPPELQSNALVTIGDALVLYQSDVAVPHSDAGVLRALSARLGAVKLSEVNLQWVEAYIAGMKRGRKLSPSTIRHHVGALGRCFDWLGRRYPPLAVNPVRLLPRRYASYSQADAEAAGTARRDEERDRRLEPGEEERIRAIMAGAKPEGRQRPLEIPHREAVVLLFDLALETGMRMREMFTLSTDQVDVSKKTVFLDKTKNGSKRQVPLSTVALQIVKLWLPKCKGEWLFPWFDGDFDKRNLDRLTARLSSQFARIFDAAGCDDLHFHDLRHELTSRLFERTQLSDVEIAKITGHSSARMLMRYANLRGSDLSVRLW